MPHAPSTYTDASAAGGIITSVCTSFENLDGRGHGTKIETTSMMVSASLLKKHWQ